MNQEQMIELSIQEAQQKVNLADALRRLKGNADFNLLIGHTYFVQQAARTVSLLASPAMQSPTNQALLMGDLRAISELQQFLNMVEVEGAKAADSITELENARLDVVTGEDE